MKLWNSVYILLSLFIPLSLHATITGRVVDSNQNGIGKAIVIFNYTADYAVTDSNGYFTIGKQATPIQPPQSRSQAVPVQFQGKALLISVDAAVPVHIEYFDVRGRLIANIFSGKLQQGVHRITIGQDFDRTFGLLRCVMGNDIHIVKCMPRFGSISAAYGNTMREEHAIGFTVQNSTTDTLRIAKNRYHAKEINVDLTENRDVGTIVLEEIEEWKTIEKKIDTLLALMTLNEKIGQMTQANIDNITTSEIGSQAVGSVFNGGTYEPPNGNNPQNWTTVIDGAHSGAATSARGIPILYGLDAVHGNGKTTGSTLFPHNIGLGCTFEPDLVRRAYRITALECAGIGTRLDFGPCVAVARNERWGRTYEGFGETPDINAIMGISAIRGLEGDDIASPTSIAACIKHPVGEGGTTNGQEDGNAQISDALLRAIHLPPFVAAISYGVQTIMPSKIQLNGTYIIGHKQVLTDIIKGELGFDGFILSDWDAIQDIGGYSSEAAVANAVNAGMDMAMTSSRAYRDAYTQALRNQAGKSIPTTRIDDAVRRILRVKMRMHLWDHPKSDATLRSSIGSAEHRAVARECVRKSLVLLKNENNTLPLDKNKRIVVVGPWADKIGAQCGGWTTKWQGCVDYVVPGTTIRKGIESIGNNVVYDVNGDNLTQADAIVVVVGEIPYAEIYGDHGMAMAGAQVPDPWKEHVQSVYLSENPYANLIQKCAQSGKPVIGVLISGRPLIITNELAECDAFVAAWLPGTEGDGIAEVLFGDYDFTGRLTHTWPKSFNQIPINTETAPGELTGSGGDPLFPFGYGLRLDGSLIQ